MQKNFRMKRKVASATLQKVLQECDMTPNRVSFDRLVIRTAAATKLPGVCKYISFIFLLLIMLSPLAFRRNISLVVINRAFGQTVEIEDHTLYEDYFEMTLKGNDIDYDGIYAKKPDGSVVFPYKTDVSTGLVIFLYDGSEMNIHIPDKSRNVLLAVLSETKGKND